jgi:hypothetical protein
MKERNGAENLEKKIRESRVAKLDPQKIIF